nr:hypothetical protein [uncultured Sphingomonas sp.]
MGTVETPIAETPAAIGAAHIGLMIEAESAQPLFLAVAMPEQIVLHRPDPGCMVAVAESDHRRMAVMDRGDAREQRVERRRRRRPADNRQVADRHRDIVVGVERGVGRPVLPVDGMVAPRLEVVDRLDRDQAIEIGHAVGTMHILLLERRPAQRSGMTYTSRCRSLPPSVNS